MMRSRFTVLATLLLFATVGARAFAESAPDANFPRSQGELKAMLQILAPAKGSAHTLENEYLARLKQYRYICNVPFENLQWDAGYQELAEHAASINSKLGKLTHTPERPAGMSDAEYDLGKRGAGQSNLFMGVTKAQACVDGWMNDSDPTNIDRTGHRRWCINPTMLKSAFGTTGNYAAMYAFDNSNKHVPDWDYVSYPAKGYMPAQFFGNRHAWTVSLNMSKYARPEQEKITVEIHTADAKLAPVGPALKLDYYHVDLGGFGSGPAIIFRPESFSTSTETPFVVNINGLKTKKGEATTLSYVVQFFNVNKAAEGSEGAVVYSKFYKQRVESIQALPEKVDQLEAYSALNEDEYFRQSDAAIQTAVQKTVQELLKDPILKREQEAAMRYKTLFALEQKAGKNKDQRVQAAYAYRDLASAYKETRAGKKAADDFERIKKDFQ